MRWKIIAPPGKRVKFWINDFSIDEGFDFFYVHDGENSTLLSLFKNGSNCMV
jgi:hypothetical protein